MSKPKRVGRFNKKLPVYTPEAGERPMPELTPDLNREPNLYEENARQRDLRMGRQTRIGRQHRILESASDRERGMARVVEATDDEYAAMRRQLRIQNRRAMMNQSEMTGRTLSQLPDELMRPEGVRIPNQAERLRMVLSETESERSQLIKNAVKGTNPLPKSASFRATKNLVKKIVRSNAARVVGGVATKVATAATVAEGVYNLGRIVKAAGEAAAAADNARKNREYQIEHYGTVERATKTRHRKKAKVATNLKQGYLLK